MQFEVELKFPLSDAAAAEGLRERLKSLGAKPDDVIPQRDVYLSHPARDFALTDEAFRVRSVGSQNFVTYKGPLVDTVTKTRREVEVAIGDGPAEADLMLEVFHALGFRSARDVIKRREAFHLIWHGRNVEAAVDDVRGLGWFLELETLADEADCDAARTTVLELARELELGASERRSYLRLLLEQDAASRPGD